MQVLIEMYRPQLQFIAEWWWACVFAAFVLAMLAGYFVAVRRIATQKMDCRGIVFPTAHAASRRDIFVGYGAGRYRMYRRVGSDTWIPHDKGGA